jgi:hypothetical protein
MGTFAMLVAGLLSPGPASAESLPAPPGFHLRASNGYSLRVFVGGNADSGQGGVLILARSRNSTVLYATDAVVTETSVEADLGAVGRIDVHFVPSGKAKTERSECGGKPFTFDGGRYEGVIDFEGEHGYSEAHVTAAPGEAKFFLSLVCSQGGSEGIGGHAPGARLTADGKGRAGVEFSAFKNSPIRPARFSASIEERRGRMEISRGVGVMAAPGAFAFDVPAGVASVEPPAPFSGRAEYSRHAGGRSTWAGDLSVDFPGRPDVPLTGTATRVSLERAVLNPSHPFRAF